MFFTPKMNQIEKMQLQSLMKQGPETEKILNTTTNPATFFSRLNFFFDVLLTMRKFEKYKVFTGNSPSVLFNTALSQLEENINSFFDRTYRKEVESSYNLKTDKARKARLDKYFADMDEIIEKCKDPQSDIRRGNPAMEHYSGVIITPNNEDYLLKLKCNSDT